MKMKSMANGRFRVGIVGLRAGSWAATAHVPALRALPDSYEISGVANTNVASATSMASHFGIPSAYRDAAELAASPDIDIVVVTVKAPHHFQVVRTALMAGKHVYCEWPLGRSLDESAELADLARSCGVVAVVGLQARFAPEIQYVKQLLADGFVGDVLSTTIVGSGYAWGARIDQANAYLLDRANGATMLTIPVAHTLAAVRDLLGALTVNSAVLANRRITARIAETGEDRPMTAHDQVLIEGVLDGGVPISVHFRGGTPRPTGFLWEINGTDGDIQLSATIGHPQMVPLTLTAARSNDSEMRVQQVPQQYCRRLADNVTAGNVARLYECLAADLHDGTSRAPTFAEGLELRRLISNIEAAADRRT